MPLDLPSFKKSLKSTFTTLNKSQADALAVEIAANYTAGRTAAEKHQSIKSAEPEEEDEGLTTEEKAEIALLVALFLGYLKEFNSRAQDQIIDEVTAMTKAGKTTEEIKDYVQDVLSGKENIIIDNTGQERKELYLDKNLKLSEVTKTVTKPYYASVLTYAALTAANASHKAYESGRGAQIKSDGYDWVFTGPADEIARPWHVCLLGQVYRWGSEQSAYAEQCLGEPHCRHRAMAYYNDKSKDVPTEEWQRLKDEAGLFWDTEAMQWGLKVTQ